MKKLLLLLLVLLFLSPACKKSTTDDSTTLSGTPSPMGVVGTTVSSTTFPISGISNLNGSVVSLSNGISSYSGTGVITNSIVKNLLSSIPGITINGDNVTATGFQFKQTLDGIESYVGIGPGIIVKYASNVGDTYPVGSTGRVRTVVSKSTTDDYPYGPYLIKVMKIVESIPAFKSVGINKVTYWANHNFGLVGIQYDLNDGSSINLPVYCSVTNGE